MDFHSTIILIALVFLILCLIGVGLSLQAGVTITSQPKIVSTCPDGWSTHSSGDGCDVPSQDHVNRGTYSKTAMDNDTKSKGKMKNTDFDTKIQFVDNATMCDKSRWAHKYGISWDGVSNFNRCYRNETTA